MIDKYLTADIVDNEALSADIQENEEVEVDMPELVVVGGNGGEDGFSPIVSLEKNGKISTLEITDKNGVHKTEILDGNDGKDGADGKTPVKGTDYFTEADKSEMVQAVVNALPVYDGEAIAE